MVTVMSRKVLFPKGCRSVVPEEVYALLNDTIPPDTEEPPLLTNAFDWAAQRKGHAFWKDAHEEYCERGKLRVSARNELSRIYEAFR